MFPFIGVLAEEEQNTTQIFPANAINFDGSTQYLELQGDPSRLNLGSSDFDLFFKLIKGSSPRQRVYSKSDISGTSYAQITIRSDINRIQFFAPSISVDINIPPISQGWHSYRIFRAGNTVNFMLDDSPIVYSSNINFGFPSTGQPLTIMHSNAVGDGDRYTDGSISLYGLIAGQTMSLEEWDYINMNTQPCWDSVATDNPTLFNKFEEVFDLCTYNGSTEVQALTGKVNGWVLDNVNNAPFNSTGLSVECSS